MLRTLESIDNALEYEVMTIVQHIKNANEYTSELFDLPIVVRDFPSDNIGLRGRYGIYIFCFLSDLHIDREMINKWSKPVFGIKFSNYYGEFDCNIGDCLYLGSSISKSLLTRVRQHYKEHYENAALLLNSKERNFIKPYIKCIVFPIKNDVKKYRKMIIPVIEKKLHETLKPLCGSSRT